METQAIDPGLDNTPPFVRREEERKRRLLSLPSDEVANEISTPAPAPDSGTVPDAVSPSVQDVPRGTFPQPADPLRAFVDLLEDYGESKEVKIHTPIGTVTLNALHVVVNRHCVGLMLPKDGVQFEPEFRAELRIELGGKPMDVVYGGGFFTFARIPITFISFFRIDKDDKDDKDDDGETRQS